MLIRIANREGPDQTASSCDSTSIHKALPGKLDIKRHSPSILSIYVKIIYI